MIKGKNKTVGCILLIVICCFLSACNSQKRELQEKVEKLQSVAIDIPYDRMGCWTSDSIMEISPWKKAKLKLIHYVDSATCSTCYLNKIVTYEQLFRMEKLSNNEFYNIFIINPSNIAKKRLETDFHDKLIPQTIFVDSANVFTEVNPNIPSESMYHTFLLDENNNVILVGCPLGNEKIGDMLQATVEKKLGKKFNTSSRNHK